VHSFISYFFAISSGEKEGKNRRQDKRKCVCVILVKFQECVVIFQIIGRKREKRGRDIVLG